MKTCFIAALGAAAMALPAAAEIVQVEITGQVEFNLISQGPLDPIQSGAPVSISFLLDSNDYADSPNFPTRGYAIDQGSFAFTAGGVAVGLESPFPAGQTPYFVVRDNDPAVDGFFLSTGVDWPTGVPLDTAGGFGAFTSVFEVSYDGSTLDSLDILGAVGSYDYTGLGSYYMGVTDGPFDAMGIIYTGMTISVVPAPAAFALLAPLGLVGRRRD